MQHGSFVSRGGKSPELIKQGETLFAVHEVIVQADGGSTYQLVLTPLSLEKSAP
ncbi:MAG: hypothetical protein WBV82_14075 [Myxococcaceae bacterium]